MTMQQFLAIFSLFALVLVALALGGCETGYGLTTFTYSVDAETGQPIMSYENGKEFGSVKADYERTGEDVKFTIEADNVKAFEGQAIAAERDKAIVEAVTNSVIEALPAALCAAGIVSACVSP